MLGDLKPCLETALQNLDLRLPGTRTTLDETGWPVTVAWELTMSSSRVGQRWKPIPVLDGVSWVLTVSTIATHFETQSSSVKQSGAHAMAAPTISSF